MAALLVVAIGLGCMALEAFMVIAYNVAADRLDARKSTKEVTK